MAPVAELKAMGHSSTWFAVVSIEILFNSLSRASHYKTIQSKNYILAGMFSKSEINQHINKWSNRELTTHPEPCRAAPSELIFWINDSSEPNCWSMAHPKDFFGGSPPPSCHNISQTHSTTMKANLFKITQIRKLAYLNRSQILPENRVVYMTFNQNKKKKYPEIITSKKLNREVEYSKFLNKIWEGQGLEWNLRRWIWWRSAI